MALPDADALRRRFRAELPQVARIVVAAAVGWSICVLLDPDQLPLYAVLVPLFAMRDHPFSALNVSFERILGVLAGVLLGILVLGLLGVTALAAAVVLTVGLLAGVILRLGSALNIQIALSGLLVFTSTNPNTYAWTRLWETAIGAVVTVAISPFLFPPDAAKQYRNEFRRVCRRLDEHMARAATLVEDAGRDHVALVALLDDVRQTHESAHALPSTLDSARRAVRNNPLRRHKIGELDAVVEVAGTVVELSRWVRHLVEELVDLSARTDIDRVWTTSGPWLSRVLNAVATAFDAALAGATDRAGDKVALAAATDALAGWRAADSDPVAVMLRRPSFRLVRVVGTLAGQEIVAMPGGSAGRPEHDLLGEPPHDQSDDGSGVVADRLGGRANPAP